MTRHARWCTAPSEHGSCSRRIGVVDLAFGSVVVGLSKTPGQLPLVTVAVLVGRRQTVVPMDGKSAEQLSAALTLANETLNS